MDAQREGEIFLQPSSPKAIAFGNLKFTSNSARTLCSPSSSPVTNSILDKQKENKMSEREKSSWFLLNAEYLRAEVALLAAIPKIGYHSDQMASSWHHYGIIIASLWHHHSIIRSTYDPRSSRHSSTAGCPLTKTSAPTGIRTGRKRTKEVMEINGDATDYLRMQLVAIVFLWHPYCPHAAI